MIRKLFLLLVIVLVGGYGAAEVAAKSYVEGKIVAAVERKDPQARDVEASVSFPVVFGLLTRSAVERVEVSASHVPAGPVVTERATAVLTNVKLDRAASLKKRSVVVSSIDLLEVTVEIGQEEVSRLLPTGFRFEFGQGTVTLRGPGVDVRGRLLVEAPSHLVFEAAPGVSLPRGVPAPRIELAGLPFLDCLRGVDAAPGVLRVTCAKEHPPPTFPPGG